MADLNIKEIADANPITSVLGTDLIYLGRSPFGTTDDRAITLQNAGLAGLDEGSILYSNENGNPSQDNSNLFFDSLNKRFLTRNIATFIDSSDTLNFQAYHTGSESYSSFITLTSGNPASCNLSDSVTKNGQYIYRAGGTDIPVADGGTGQSTLTQNNVLLGNGTSGIQTTGSLATQEILTVLNGVPRFMPPYSSPIGQWFRGFESSAWSSQTAAAANQWMRVIWVSELGLFVAVAASGSGNRVMTSPDGENWTSRTSASNSTWFGLCWAKEIGLLVAVGTEGTVMTSPDGIEWTSQTPAAANQWYGVCWSPKLRLLVAVASSGTGNRVMTSSDGVNWTSRTSASNNNWRSVVWADKLNLFVAVAASGSGNRVMTSPDGENWTSRSSANNNFWFSIDWSDELGLLCACATDSTSDQIMTSSDGINWTGISVTNTSQWWDVKWSKEMRMFVVCGRPGTASQNRILYSYDGVNWDTHASANNDNEWSGICFSPDLGIWCAVSINGTSRVMTSPYPTDVLSPDASFDTVNVSDRIIIGKPIAETLPSGLVHISNNDTDLLIRINTNTSGNPQVRWMLDGTSIFCHGLDRSDSNTLKINSGTALSTNGINMTTGNSIGLGGAPSASAKFEVISTTQGIRFSNMTEAQRDAISSPVAGLVIYNTSTNKLNIFTDAWEVISSS